MRACRSRSRRRRRRYDSGDYNPREPPAPGELPFNPLVIANPFAHGEKAHRLGEGESVYAFLPRAIFGGFASAWRINRRRVIRSLLASSVVYLGVGIVFGGVGIALFALQSAIAMSMLEVINYVQHYGLTRERQVDGRYERVSRNHAWNAAHPVSNWFLLNLGHHSDHHCDGGKDFHTLAPMSAAPQLPLGLFGMFVLALLPPLWHQIMDPLAMRVQEQVASSRPDF